MVPTLAVLLAVGPLISLAVPRGSRSAVTTVTTIANPTLWIVVILIPVTLEEAGDGPVGPSLLERLGLPFATNEAIAGVLWAAVPVLLLVIWVTLIVAAVAARRARRTLVSVPPGAGSAQR